jgi:pilus assembly protein Flp/PilA
MEALRVPGRREACARGDRGASAVEYGLILMAVAALIVVAVYALGGQVKTMFQDSTTCIDKHTSADC